MSGGGLPVPYYEDDAVTLYHGDAREVLPLLSGAAAVVTDPPYGTEALGGGYGRRQLARNPDPSLSHTIAGDADLSVFAAVAALWRPLLPADAWVLAFCAPRRRRDAEDVLLLAGAEMVGEAVWHKGRAGLGYTIRYAHETVLVARYGTPPTGAGPLLSVLRGHRTSEKMSARHPHEKPSEVMGRLIEFAAGPGGVVLDPFAGSGSTLRAAKDVGRRAIGIELEERYCEVAAKRLSQGVLDFGIA